MTPRYQVAVTMCTSCRRGWQYGGAGGGTSLLSPPELERALCEGHHLALHEGSLIIEGDAVDPTFTWSKQSNYKIETRAVECGAALRARGIAKELVKAAVAATRTHVGKQDLTTRQWVDIALAKVPQGPSGA